MDFAGHYRRGRDAKSKNDSTFHNPRWASEAQNVVTVEAIEALYRSSSAAQSKFRHSSPSWRPGRVLKTRNMALWKAEERRGDMVIPRSRQEIDWGLHEVWI